MAITISGENNNDRILAQDGVIDSISGFNIAGIITASSFTGDLTGDVTGNLSGNVTGNINNTTLLLQTGGSERVRITSDGKISTGALASPDGNLHVYSSSAGSVTAASDANELVLESSANVGMSFLTASNSLSRIKFGDSRQSNRGVIAYNHSVDCITFHTVGNERLRIDSSGKVGIGTNNPSKTLHVFKSNEHPVMFERGDASNTQVELRTAGATRGYWGSSTTANFMVYDNDASDVNFTVLQTGNVGIGTDNPASPLQVVSSANNIVQIRSTTRYSTMYMFDSIGSTFIQCDSGNLRFGTGGGANASGGENEALRIDSNGRVLIGHSSTPQAAASVAVVGSYGASSTLTPFVYLCRDEDATSIGSNESLGQILFASRDGYRGAVIEAKAGGTWSGSSSTAYLVIKTTPDNATVPAERLTVGTGGNVTLKTDSNIAEAIRIAPAVDASSQQEFGIGLAVNSGHNHPAAKITFKEYDVSDSRGDLLFYTRGANSDSAPEERLRITSDGKVGINNSSPTNQLSVKHDGLADNNYAFATEYRSGNNASGYTASGISIVSSANNSNGEKHTAYIKFSNRDPALNTSHGAGAFITMSTPDSPGTYGTGEFNFYCRNGSAYTFPNDPAIGSSYWMSSLFKIKSTGELFGYGNLRIDTGTAADGIVGRAYGTAYFGLKQADQSSDEYMMISNNNHTYISCTSGYSIYMRPSANSSAHETIFSHDNTEFNTNIVLDNHQLRRNQHHKGHMEGGHNNIGSTAVKTSPIYTIGSAYNPNENDLNNMYGIGFTTKDASFISSNVPSGWGQYVASDGDARIFLHGGNGIVYANGGYGRIGHHTGHLIGSYNNVGNNSTKTNPIYTIGSSYNPAESTLSNMYGIGYGHGNNASFLNFSGLTGWGLYVAADGDARMFLDATTGKIAANGTITGGSDVRLKTNIKVIDNPIEKINKIRGVTFDWVDNITSEYDFHPDSMHETGVIAQEIQEVIPDAVATAPFNGNYTMKSGTDNNYLTVQHEKIIPLCIEAIKELSAKVEALESEVNTLKGS